MQQVHPSVYYPDRKDIRLKGYDYRTQGCYFLTIVTQNRVNFFGEVTDDGEMKLNEDGEMVTSVYNSMNDYNENIMMQDMVVMPNHLHCIVALANNDSIGISLLMRFFKSKTTVEYIKGVKEKGWKRFDGHLWQSRFYDHIIRCQPAYDKIREYIHLNPSRWNKDKLNVACEQDADDINTMIKQYEIYSP